MDLITWEEVRDFLSIREEHKSVTTMIIEAVSAQARRIMGRKITQTCLTEIRKGDGSRVILLKQFPVTSITALYLDSSRIFTDESKLAESDYHLDLSTGKIELHFLCFPSEAAGYSIRVDYEAGYEKVPADIRLAVLETIRWNYNRITLNGVGLRQESFEGASQTYEIKVPTSAMMIFRSYRRANI